jgi:hypothetical protein
LLYFQASKIDGNMETKHIMASNHQLQPLKDNLLVSLFTGRFYATPSGQYLADSILHILVYNLAVLFYNLRNDLSDFAVCIRTYRKQSRAQCQGLSGHYAQ